MTKYLTKSAEVLSAADRQEDIIDWILFSNEQNSRIFAELGPEEWWRPGIPLYKKPDGWMEAGAQYIRPMIQEQPIGRFHNIDAVKYIQRCNDCETSWAGKDVCFNCGEYVEPTSFAHEYVRNETDTFLQMISLLERNPEHLAVDYDIDYDQYHFRGYTYSAEMVEQELLSRRARREEQERRRDNLRGLRTSFAVMDEAVETSRHNMEQFTAEIARDGLAEWQTHWIRAYFSDQVLAPDQAVELLGWQTYYMREPTPEPESVFIKPEIRGPLYDVAALWSPFDEPVYIIPGSVTRFVAEAELKLPYCTEIPLPEDIRPRLDFESFNRQPAYILSWRVRS
jgi:hypothetical protein